jgi:hypothetical protein
MQWLLHLHPWVDDTQLNNQTPIGTTGTAVPSSSSSCSDTSSTAAAAAASPNLRDESSQ